MQPNDHTPPHRAVRRPVRCTAPALRKRRMPWRGWDLLRRWDPRCRMRLPRRRRGQKNTSNADTSISQRHENTPTYENHFGFEPVKAARARQRRATFQSAATGFTSFYNSSDRAVTRLSPVTRRPPVPAWHDSARGPLTLRIGLARRLLYLRPTSQTHSSIGGTTS